MNVRFRYLAIAVAVAGLSACATMDERYAMRPSSDYQIRTDKHYVATVEHIAKHKGVRVFWVNPPVERTERPDKQ